MQQFKLLHIIISCLLLVSTTGISVSKHICGDRIHDLAIYHQAENCLGAHGMDMNGCCEDENINYKITDEFQQEFSLISSIDLKVLYIIPVLFNISFENRNHNKFFFNFKSPPIADPGEILIKVQQFLL